MSSSLPDRSTSCFICSRPDVDIPMAQVIQELGISFWGERGRHRSWIHVVILSSKPINDLEFFSMICWKLASDPFRSTTIFRQRSTTPVLRSRLMCATEKVKRRGSVLKTCGDSGIWDMVVMMHHMRVSWNGGT